MNEYSIGEIMKNADKINKRYEEARKIHGDKYWQGKRDCEIGAVADKKGCENYMRGYGHQYQYEQNMGALSRGN